MILSLVLGRMRSGVGLLVIKDLSSATNKNLDSLLFRPSSKAFLIGHNDVAKQDLPDFILDKVAKSIAQFSETAPVYRTGILALDGKTSESSLDTIRLHAILRHELRKQYSESPVDVSIQQVRRSLGISSSSSSSKRRDLITHFKSSGCEFEDPQTTSGMQILSESWGVAHHLNRLHHLKEIKSSCPDLIEKFRNQILSNRKLFAPCPHSDPEVINDLLDQEIDKLLVKRFNL